MASKYVKDLRNLGERLKLDDGLPVSAEICITAANRMDSMEQYVIELNWRPFAEGNYPDEDEEIVARLHDGHTIITHFQQKDIKEMKNEGVENWLRIPECVPT